MKTSNGEKNVALLLIGPPILELESRIYIIDFTYESDMARKNE
jgi:hypothetical protein